MLILEAFGLKEDLIGIPSTRRPTDRSCADGQLDAFFFVGRSARAADHRLAETMAVDLVPITGAPAQGLHARPIRSSPPTTFPPGPIRASTRRRRRVGAQWLVSATCRRSRSTASPGAVARFDPQAAGRGAPQGQLSVRKPRWTASASRCIRAPAVTIAKPGCCREPAASGARGFLDGGLLRLEQLAQDDVALEGRQPVDEEDAVEMVDLVLQAGREQP